MTSVPINVDGLPASSGNPVPTNDTRRFAGGKTPYSAVIAAAGDTTIVTPAAGKSIRVSWVGFVPNTDNTTANLVVVQFGPTSGTHSPIYTCYAMSHWEQFTGAVDQPLVVNLANAQPVAINVHFEEL